MSVLLLSPTGVCPIDMIPTGVWPTDVGPTGVCPTGVWATGVGPTNVCPIDVSPTVLFVPGFVILVSGFFIGICFFGGFFPTGFVLLVYVSTGFYTFI